MSSPARMPAIIPAGLDWFRPESVLGARLANGFSSLILRRVNLIRPSVTIQVKNHSNGDVYARGRMRGQISIRPAPSQSLFAFNEMRDSLAGQDEAPIHRLTADARRDAGAQMLEVVRALDPCRDWLIQNDIQRFVEQTKGLTKLSAPAGSFSGGLSRCRDTPVCLPRFGPGLRA